MPLLAHPLSHPGQLAVPPLVAMGLAAVVAGALVMLWPGRATGPRERPPGPVDSWDGPLRPAQIATRILGLVLLALAVVAGRFGSERELHNVAPALVVGAGWPALVVLSAVLGPVWRWLDPWDAAARALVPGKEEVPARPVGRKRVRRRSNRRPDLSVGRAVWLAVVPALLWTWYLSVYPKPTAPRSVGLALGVYTMSTIGGCLAVGRRRWLSRAEVFGLLFGWLARLPRGRLAAWEPPRGAEVVLGVLAGGLMFGQVRTSEVWGGLNAVPGALGWATLGMAGTCAVAGGVLWFLSQWSGRRAPGGVAAASVPMVGAIAVAVGMARGRLFTSMSLLPSLASDPLGRGWDLFGTADAPTAAPLPGTRLALVQLAVLLAGMVAAAVVLARWDRGARAAGASAVAALAGGGTLAVMVAPGLTHG